MKWTDLICHVVALLGWPLLLTAQPAKPLAGRVTAYLANRIGDYEGLQLRTASGTVRVRFPPHTAAQVLRQAPIGQPVIATVSGETTHPPRHETSSRDEAEPAYRLVRIQNQVKKTGVRLADLPPPPPAPGRLVDTDGPLTGALHDDAGRLSALLISQYIIALKPHQSESIQALLAGVTRLGVVGYERTEPGFVNKTGRKLIHPTILLINGQTFAL